MSEQQQASRRAKMAGVCCAAIMLLAIGLVVFHGPEPRPAVATPTPSVAAAIPTSPAATPEASFEPVLAATLATPAAPAATVVDHVGEATVVMAGPSVPAAPIALPAAGGGGGR